MRAAIVEGPQDTDHLAPIERLSAERLPVPIDGEQEFGLIAQPRIEASGESQGADPPRDRAGRIGEGFIATPRIVAIEIHIITTCYHCCRCSGDVAFERPPGVAIGINRPG